MNITLEQREYIARHIQQWVFQHLISVTSIDQITALTGATDAANEHGRMLALVLSEKGVDVEQRS